MEFETITITKHENIAKITFNQPEKRNPLTNQMKDEVISSVRNLDEDPSVHVIIIASTGKAFSAGGNLRSFVEKKKSATELFQESLESDNIFSLGAEVRTPLIASVNGAALGGGTGIAAMCHITISSDRAKFGTTELKLGLVPYVILPWIRRSVGHKNALDMMLTADILTAEQAKELGLVQRVVSHEDLEEETMQIARKIASYSPLAVKLGLEAFYNTEDMDLMKSFEYLKTLRVLSFSSEDLKEGASAFLEKREPEWKGK